jgi:hypothetical protein
MLRVSCTNGEVLRIDLQPAGEEFKGRPWNYQKIITRMRPDKSWRLLDLWEARETLVARGPRWDSVFSLLDYTELYDDSGRIPKEHADVKPVRHPLQRRPVHVTDR